MQPSLALLVLRHSSSQRLGRLVGYGLLKVSGGGREGGGGGEGGREGGREGREHKH